MWGSLCEDRGRALSLGCGKRLRRRGSVVVLPERKADVFHSGVCQVCRATFSCLEVRSLIRGLGAGHFGGKRFNFDATTY